MNIISVIFYLTITLITTYLCFLYQKCNNKTQKVLLAAAIIFVPSFFAGIRINIGTDFTIHQSVFEDIIFGSNIEKRAEIGYVFLNQIVVWFGGGYHVVLFLVSLITFSCLFLSFNELNDEISIPFAMFAYMLLYYQMSFNYIRQLLAAAIGVFACVLFLKKNRKKLSIIICLLASSFHITGLIYIPVLLFYDFLSNNKYLVKRNIMFIFLSILVFIYPIVLMPLFEIIQDIFPSLRYFINYLAVEYKSIGFGFFRYPLLFMIFGILFYSRMEKKFKWMFNVMILGFIFWLTSYVTKMEFYRMSHMYLIFIPIIYGYFWKNIFKFSNAIPLCHNKLIYEHREILIKAFMILMLLFFWYYDFFYLGAHETVPYQSIFTNFNYIFMKGI